MATWTVTHPTIPAMSGQYSASCPVGAVRAALAARYPTTVADSAAFGLWQIAAAGDDGAGRPSQWLVLNTGGVGRQLISVFPMPGESVSWPPA